MNMKRFIIVPVVFALGWLSFGSGSALSRENWKVMSRNAGKSEMEDGPVSRAVCPCNHLNSKNSGCQDIGLVLPCICKEGFYGDKCDDACGCDDAGAEGKGCDLNGQCRCKKGFSGKQCNEMQVLNLGSAKMGERWYFKVTCNGLCKQVNASVKALSGNPELYVALHNPPRLTFHSGCHNCICVSEMSGTVNSCQLSSLNSNSFAVSVLAYSDVEKVTFEVEALNFKGLREINVRSKLLNSLEQGERRNFKVTCYGQCKEVAVYVTASSGIPDVFVAKSLHNVTIGNYCKDCICQSTKHTKVNGCQFDILEEDSFAVTVSAYHDSDDVILSIAALNVKELKAL